VHQATGNKAKAVKAIAVVISAKATAREQKQQQQQHVTDISLCQLGANFEYSLSCRNEIRSLAKLLSFSACVLNVF